MPFWPPLQRLACRCTDMLSQPEKRYLLVWIVLAAIAVILVVGINLVIRVQAI